MRILIVSNLYPPNVVGGYERLCFEVTAGLAARGHQMVVLTTRYGGKQADYPGQRVLRNLDLLTGADIYTPFAGDRAAVNESNLVTLQRTLAAERPDVIFAWNLFFLDVSILNALEASRIRTVVMLTDNWLLVMRDGMFVHNFFKDTVHGSQALVPRPGPPLWRRIARAVRRRVRPRPELEAIFGADYMRRFYAAGGQRFMRDRVIHNGVTQNGYAPVPAPNRAALLHPGTLRLLFAGRLVDLKGAHTAIAALALLDAAACGVAQIRLTIVGDAQDSAYMDVLHEAIAASGKGDEIALCPSVAETELPALFAAHDVYLFPSLYEPFSLTLIHALALGIPTIATDIGGNPEIVRDGVSGLLVPKSDPVAMAAAITRLAADGALRARLAAGGRAAAAGFTFDRMVDEMAAFLAVAR